MTGPRRRAVEKEFETPSKQILLATDAASEGLNLQRLCRRVLHFELPWNPNRLEQRNGRVDRYGQTRSPLIRYLFYPDSPEDEILGRLAEKIEEMRDARVSTPDILGILLGNADLGQRLVDLDPEASDLAERRSSLVRHFEDRTADFVRNVQPFLTSDAPRELLESLQRAEPLLADDPSLEQAARALLGAQKMTAHSGPEGVFRIEVPLAYRGPAVLPVYPRATFRRSTAIRFPSEEVEFITPVHPLIRALADEALRRLLFVYPGERGLPARRLSVARMPRDAMAGALFTFLSTIRGGGGLLEERILQVRMGVDGKVLGTAQGTNGLPEKEAQGEEVDPTSIQHQFEGCFEELARKAWDTAETLQAQRCTSLRTHRSAQATILRRELEEDTRDRLQEIDMAATRSRGGVEETSGQLLLFDDPEANSFKTRRAAIESQAAARREEIDGFERVDDAASVQPLGALLLVPAGQ